MDKIIKLDIIGIGNMGSAHARKIYQGMCPDFQLVAVADTSDSYGGTAGGEYKDRWKTS